MPRTRHLKTNRHKNGKSRKRYYSSISIDRSHSTDITKNTNINEQNYDRPLVIEKNIFVDSKNRYHVNELLHFNIL
jgi:hypothetical protein